MAGIKLKTNTLDVLLAEVERTSARREHCAATLAVLQRTVARYRQILDPNLRSVAAGEQPTIDEILDARAEVVATEARAAAAEREFRAADREASAAAVAYRDARLAELHPLKVAAVRELAEALAHARVKVDALIEVEDREQAIGGSQAERLSAAWASLATSPDTSVFVPQLDFWRAYAADLGLLRAGQE